MTDLRGIEEIFCSAIEIASAADRIEFVARACRGDSDLQRRVESLLKAHERGGSIVDAADSGPEPTRVDSARPPSVGLQIGPYKLLDRIGEGGMGTVFMAEQTHPVRRRVALKVIKPGMDSAQVVARFEAERQALALMDHVNIARVFDAGATADGLPYFVMELVHGLPITRYCDDNQLTPRQRLQLFIPVCQAIQHAHQKGIIHRDIKPSNVMVTLYDGHPVPKVIDFGVAKAIEQKLTERTLFTQYGTMVGTLEYMSPEQAEMSALGVDTRSDIYSLGVLLYELLTGSTPLDRRRLGNAAFAEVLRLIREVDPPRPSTRLSQSGDALPSISALRRMEPSKLTRLLRGELDWIVLKTLEKDRSRRYATASAFAEDVQHFLNDEPVQACPPSVSYAARKFVRRHRTALAVSGCLATSLIVCLGGIGWTIAAQQRQQAEVEGARALTRAKVAGQLELIEGEVARSIATDQWEEAFRSLLRADPLLTLDDVPADLGARLEHTRAGLSLIRRLEEIREQSGTVWGIEQLAFATRIDQAYRDAFLSVAIDVDGRPAPEVMQQVASYGDMARGLTPILDDWIAVRVATGNEDSVRRLARVVNLVDTDDWRRGVRDAVARRDRRSLDRMATPADLDRQPASTLSLLCAAFQGHSRFADHHGSLLHWAQRRFPNDYWVNHRLGVDLIWKRRPDLVQEGIGYLRAAVAIRPQSSHSLMNLGNGYSFLGQYARARSYFAQGLAISPRSAGCLQGAGLAHAAEGQYDEAVQALNDSIQISPANVSESYAVLSRILSTRPDAAKRDPQRAFELAEAIVAREPQASNHWTALGLAQFRTGDITGASGSLEKGLRLATHCWNGAFRWDDATNYFVLAMCHHQQGAHADAVRTYELGLSWMKQNPVTSEIVLRLQREAASLLGRDDSGLLEQTAVGLEKRAEALEKQGRSQESQQLFTEAAERYQLLTVAFPAVPNYTNRLARLLNKLGRGNELELVYRRAISGHAALPDPDPQQRLAWSIACNEMSNYLGRAHCHVEAEGFVRQAVALKEALARDFPENLEYRFHLAHSYLGLAYAVAERHQDQETVDLTNRAREMFAELAATTTARPDFRKWNAHGLQQLVPHLLRYRQCDDARVAAEVALNTFVDLAQSQSPNLTDRHEQAKGLCLLSDVEQAAGQPVISVERLNEALRIYGELTEIEPATYRPRLADTQVVLLRRFVQMRDFDRAQALLHETYALHRSVFSDAPLQTGLRSSLADKLNDLAWRLVVTQEPEEAALRLANDLTLHTSELHPSGGHLWSTRAIILLRAEDFAGCVELDTKAKTLGFENELSHFVAAIAYWHLGERDLSRRRFELGVRLVEKTAVDYEALRLIRREAHELLRESLPEAPRPSAWTPRSAWQSWSSLDGLHLSLITLLPQSLIPGSPGLARTP